MNYNFSLNFIFLSCFVSDIYIYNFNIDFTCHELGNHKSVYSKFIPLPLQLRWNFIRYNIYCKQSFSNIKLTFIFVRQRQKSWLKLRLPFTEKKTWTCFLCVSFKYKTLIASIKRSGLCVKDTEIKSQNY